MLSLSKHLASLVNSFYYCNEVIEMLRLRLRLRGRQMSMTA